MPVFCIIANVTASPTNMIADESLSFASIEEARDFIEELFQVGDVDSDESTTSTTTLMLLSAIKQYPSLASERNGTYLLTSIFMLRPSLSLVQQVYRLFPQAIEEVDELCGWMPLHLACAITHQPEVARFLANAHPAALRHRGIADDTVLHATLVNKNPNVRRELVQFLVEKEPRLLTIRNRDGWLPIEEVYASSLRNPNDSKPSHDDDNNDDMLLEFMANRYPDDTLKVSSFLNPESPIEFNDRCIRSLLGRNSPNVRHLDVTGFHLTDSGYWQLFEWCRTNPALTKLTFAIDRDDNDKDDNDDEKDSLLIREGPLALQRLLEDNTTSLAHLDVLFRGSHRASQQYAWVWVWVVALAEGLSKNTRLQSFSVDSGIRFPYAAELYRALTLNQSLSKVALYNMPHRCTIDHHSDKDSDRITAQQGSNNAYMSLQEWLSHAGSHLRSLTLSTCGLTRLEPLVEGPSTLRELSISDWQLQPSCLEALSRLTRLDRLSLSFPNIVDCTPVIDAILPLIGTNSSSLGLQRLSLDLGKISERVSERDADRIAMAARTCRRLTHLSLGRLQEPKLHPFVSILRTDNVYLEHVHLQGHVPHHHESEDELSLALSYYCELNKAGRRIARQPNASKEEVVSLLAGRQTNQNVGLIYGLLREAPHVWA